jgi:hypothetical protein
MIRPVLLLALIAGTLPSCVEMEACPPLDRAQPTSLSDHSLIVGGVAVSLETTVSGEGGTPPLTGLGPGIGVQLVARTTSADALAALMPVCVHVAHDGESWQTRLDQGSRSHNAVSGVDVSIMGASSGPRWPPGDVVHVTVWLDVAGTLRHIDLGEFEIRAVV